MKKMLSSFLAVVITMVNISLPVYATDTNTFTAIINVYNEETNESVPNIDVRFVEYSSDFPTNRKPQAQIVQVLAEWNTSDVNPYIIEDIHFVEGHFYAVLIDQIPEGFCYSWKDHVISGIHGNGILKGDVNYKIALQPHNPLPDLEYPLDITRNFTFSIVDKSTGQAVEGLDVELAQLEQDGNKQRYVKTLDQWNTKDDSKHTFTMPVHFDSDDDPGILFGMKINNLPDDYEYWNLPPEGYDFCGAFQPHEYKWDLYNNYETDDYVTYIYPKDEPRHYVTSATSTDQGTETTATTITQNMKGDVNIDGVVDVSDAVLLARFCAEDADAVITEQGKRNADANGNDKLTGDDVIVILKMIAKLI